MRRPFGVFGIISLSTLRIFQDFVDRPAVESVQSNPLGISGGGSSIMSLPVVRPALESVQFGLENIRDTIRVAWFPFTIVVSLYVGVFIAIGLSVFDAELSGMEIPDIKFEELFLGVGSQNSILVWTVVLPVLSLFIMSCVYVALMRVAADPEYAFFDGIAFFRFGLREFRYAFASIAYLFVYRVVGIVTLSAIAGLSVAMANFIAAIEGVERWVIGIPTFLLIVSVLLLSLFVLIRLLLLMPIAAIENRIDFGRAWQMSAGNFWRIAFSGIILCLLIFTLTLFSYIVFAFFSFFIIQIFAMAGIAFWDSIGYIGIAASSILFIVFASCLMAFYLGTITAFPARIYTYLCRRSDRAF